MTAPSNANTSGLSDACAQEEADTLALKLTNAEIIAASWKDRATAAEARADRLAKALEPFSRIARWARLCGMSDLEKATAKYAKRNLFWDQFSAADAALNGDADHAG